MYCKYWRVTEKTVASRLPAALAYKLIRRGCSPADLATLARYAMAARRARPAADKGWPGDQARPRGLKPRAAAAATARRVPSRWRRSSRAAGDRLLSGAGDQAGGCSGLQGGEPRAGGTYTSAPSSQSTLSTRSVSPPARPSVTPCWTQCWHTAYSSAAGSNDSGAQLGTWDDTYLIYSQDRCR